MSSKSNHKEMDEKQRQKYVAIIRQLKEKKGLTIKQSEFNQDLQECKSRQQQLIDLKKQYPDSPAVQEEANKSFKKLQTIIDNINEYMEVLHPEGLIDFGSAPSGQVLNQG